MGRWRATFQLKDLLLREDVDPGTAVSLAGEVVTRLRRSGCFYPVPKRVLIETFQQVEDQETFNQALDVLYDVADEGLVWVS